MIMTRMMILGCGLVAAVIGSAELQAASIEYKGHEYKLVSAVDDDDPALRTWNKAQASAQSLGSGWDLVSINDQDENDWLLKEFGDDVVMAAFIGLYQEQGAQGRDEGWKWISGETATYRNWNDNEPNDVDGTENGEEQFGAMYFNMDTAAWNGKWNDLSLKLKTGDEYRWGIAECIRPVPDGGMTFGLLGLALAGLGLVRRKVS